MTLFTLLLLSATPAEQAERALAALHGNDPAAMLSLCSQSSALQTIEHWADPSRLVAPSPAIDRYKAANAFLLLGGACGPAGRSTALIRLRDVRSARDLEWLALQNFTPGKPDPKAREVLDKVEAYAAVEQQAMLAFAKRKDASLVDDLLPRLTKDVSMQVPSVEYFIATAPRDQKVTSALVALRKTTNSQLLVDHIDAYLKL